MMDKLYFDTQTFAMISSRLSAVSNKMESIASELSGLNLSQDAGASLLLSLSNLRFRMLGVSLADEIAELAIKRMARTMRQAASEAADLRLRVLSTIDVMETGEQDVIAMINDLCTDATEWSQRQSSQAGVSAWQEDVVEAVIRRFDSVTTPDENACIQKAEEIRDDGFYQFAEGLYSIVTGDFSNAVQSEATREQYMIQALMDSCTDSNSVLDEASARRMAQVYINSNNESMQKAGKYIETYLNSNDITRLAMDTAILQRMLFRKSIARSKVKFMV